jgi:chromosome segregation ATPase
MSDLLRRIADQEADNTRLQKEKTAAKESARDLHGRLNQTTQSLTTLTNSYAKRLAEKDALLNENIEIERRHTKMGTETTEFARNISNMTIRIKDMEGQIQAYEIENADLRGHLATLETESNNLRGRIGDLESGQRQTRNPESAVQDMRNSRNETAQLFRSDLDASPSHHEEDYDLDIRYNEAVYTEHRGRPGGFQDSDIYRPDPRRERESRRNARYKASNSGRSNVNDRPATGCRAERR